MQNLSQTEQTQCHETISALMDGEVTLAECDQLLMSPTDGVHLERLSTLASYQVIGHALRRQTALAQMNEIAFVTQWRSRMAAVSNPQVQRMDKPAANDARWKWVVGFASFSFLAVGVWFTGLVPGQSQNGQKMVDQQRADQQSAPSETFAQARAKRQLILTQSSRGAVWRDPELDAVLLQQRVMGDVVVIPATTVRNVTFQTRSDK